MGFCTQFLLALLILAKFDQAFCGTWLSFTDGSADRLALSNSVPVQPNGDPGRPIGADPLEVLLSSCNENYMTRAQRSEAPKSDVLRLCKALLESMQQ
uniref:Secreted protein n=1 Tax=Bursaphelenchus xylophilus TaxID=6326 RepID=A0A1I7RP98_BURXY